MLNYDKLFVWLQKAICNCNNKRNFQKLGFWRRKKIFCLLYKIHLSTNVRSRRLKEPNSHKKLKKYKKLLKQFTKNNYVKNANFLMSIIRC